MVTEWQIGDRINDRWEIHRILRGGMGVVYIVFDHHPAFREAFAAKTFRDEVFDQYPVIGDRFIKEAINALKIDPHANVNHARLAEIIDGKPFLFSEYVSGGDLSRLIGKPTLTRDLPRVLELGMQFCDGMVHLQSQRIRVHRDIKPQNCLMTEDGTLKITDFGLAKVFDDPHQGESATPQPGRWRNFEVTLLGFFGLRRSDESEPPSSAAEGLSMGLTRTGVAAGTPPYMAPEQFEDARVVDQRADIYAFGIMLFQMVSGQLPFKAQTWKNYEQLHKTESPPLDDFSPRSLRAIVEGCLAKDPLDRFQNFGVVREALSESYEALTGALAPQPTVAAEPDAVQLYNRGVGLGDLSRPHEALGYYDRALALNPAFEQALYNKGVTLAEQREYQLALGCYDRAIALNPNYHQAWCNRGFVLDSLGQSAAALTAYDKALSISPSNGLALSNKGAALDTLGRTDEALACLDLALALDPENQRALINKGTALYKSGRNDEAIACFDRALQLNPRYQKAWFNKGTLLSELGRDGEAVACFEQAIAIDQRDSDSWINKANVLSNLGKVREALTCYDRGLEINPEDAQGWVNKGATLGEVGRLQEALECFRRAKHLDHPNADELIAFCRAGLPRQL
jgi:tetratricopeptide (TPR) repeat protein